MILEAICNTSEALYKSKFLNKIAEYCYLLLIKKRYSQNTIEYNSILEEIHQRGNLYDLRNPLDRIKAKEDKTLNDLFVKSNNLLQKEKRMFIPFNTVIKWNVKINNLCANANMFATKKLGLYYIL